MSIPCLAIGLALLAQPPAGHEAALKDILVPFYARQAAKYDLFLDENRTKRLELKEQPLLTWTNAEGYLGSVFVWTYGGRPEVVGCIGSRQNAAGECFPFHELHSLSLGGLQPVKHGDGKRLWKPPHPGTEPQPVEGAPDPADSERQRLTQMRNLAREFSGYMNLDGDVTELRLLPQPIFRYSAVKQEVLDGALFALVWKGTDPDVLLMLECREVGGRPRWQYALARFNWHELWVKHKDHEVWRVRQSGLGTSSSYISGPVAQTNVAAIRETLGK
jgi:hypothetical protein